MKETIMYCHRYKTREYDKFLMDYYYTHFFSHPKTTQICDSKENVYKVKVRELKNGEESIYWGWWDNKRNAFVFVHPTRDILSICFPHSIESYIEKGKGKDYNVMIEEIEIEIIGSGKK